MRQERKCPALSPRLNLFRRSRARPFNALLQPRKANCAKNDLSTDDVAWRTGEAKRASKFHIFAQSCSHLIARRVSLDPRHVQVLILRRGESLFRARGSGAAEQLLVEREILSAVRILHAHSDRDPRRLGRARSEDR